MILAAFIPHAPFDRLDKDLTDFFAILAAFAFLLGAGNLVRIHLMKVSNRRKGWGFSAVTLLAFFFTLIVGVFKFGNPDGIRGALDATGTIYSSVYEYAFKPLSSTMFSLLAFYVASASYRAFRAKNREATMLLIAAFIILLGRTPVGVAITAKLPGSVELIFAVVLAYVGWKSFKSKQMIAAVILWAGGAFAAGRTIYAYIVNAGGGDIELITVPKLVNWIMLSPQMAGQRAIMLGICLGVVSMSLRIILGVERSHLGSDSD